MSNKPNELLDKSECNILLIDDSYSQRELISSILQTEGYRIITSETGEAGLLEIEHKLFDLILLDIVLPDISGFQMITVIKKLKINENTPIIFLTALSQVSEIVKGFQLGANDYVLKPFEKEVLLARIELQLKLSKTIDALQSEISSKQKLIVKFEDQKQQLKELNNTKDKIFSVLVHDIKNQINGVFGLSKMLLSSSSVIDERKQKYFLRMIYSSSVAINEFVGNVNGWVKKSVRECEPANVQLIKVIEEYAELYKIVAESKNIEISFHLEDIHVVFDKTMLRSIVKNLISNAIKYTRNDGGVSISGQTSTNDTKNFTLVSNLIDAYEKSEYFKNVEGRDYNKSGGNETSYTGDFRISMELETKQ